MDRSGSPLRSDGASAIPLRTLAARNAGGDGSMNRKTSRNNLLTANTRRKTASRAKLRESDEEASQSLLRNSSNSFTPTGGYRGIGRAAVTAEAEQDGDFDNGWKGSANGNVEDDDEQALLEEGRILVSSTVYKSMVAKDYRRADTSS